MCGLTTDQKRFYKENGYIILKNLISEEELSAITEQYDELFRRKNQEKMESSWVGSDADDRKNTGAHTVKGIHNLQYHHEVFATFLYNKGLLDALEDIMETSNIVLHHTKAHFKPPEKGAAYPMHQDYHYFPYENDSMVAAFVHLDAAGPENGGLCVYPGSHKLGPLEDVGAKESNFHYVDQTKFPLEGATPVVADRGDIVVFSYLLIHGSPVNSSFRPRRMLLMQVASADDTPLGEQPQRPVVFTICVPYGSLQPTESTISELDFLKKQEYDYAHKLYSPNYGYVPYWDESLKATTERMDLETSGTTTVKYYACGEECNYLYLRMGKICVHNVSDITYYGCHPIPGVWWCYGNWPGDISGNFLTYENYCEFMDAQCTVTQNNARLVFLHTGACRPQDHYFKQRFDNSTIVKDLDTYNNTANILMQNWRDEYTP